MLSRADILFEFIEKNLSFDPLANAAVMNTMRILKRLNLGDSYYENYMWHWNKRPDSFVDYYHLLWKLGSRFEFKNIMEIGCRTGISIAQFLSSMKDPSQPLVILFDLFNDGFISQDLVKMNLRALNLPLEKIAFYEGDSQTKVPEFRAEFSETKMDYILVDGCHDPKVAYVDLTNASMMLAEGGLLFFDDIAPDGCSLLSTWEEFKKFHWKDFHFTQNLDGKGIGIGVKR